MTTNSLIKLRDSMRQLSRAHGLSGQILRYMIVFICMGLTHECALAQDSGAGGNEISLHMGELLPNQIKGVTEILPIIGARYALGLGGSGMLEFGVANSHAYGVDFSILTASLRGEIDVAPDVTGLIYIGSDLNWYRPTTSSSRLLESGLHVGTAILMKTAETISLRSDLKLSGGPGTSLYLGFGVVFKR
jgi:hypothetical protein